MAQAARDGNFVPTLLGVSTTDGSTPIVVYANPSTHRLLVDASGGSTAFVDNEVVSGSSTTFTLANTPTAGSQHVYGNGQRLTPGAGNDYTIAGAVITILAGSYSAGAVLADYRH